jgi:hypothetical protein
MCAYVHGIFGEPKTTRSDFLVCAQGMLYRIYVEVIYKLDYEILESVNSLQSL